MTSSNGHHPELGPLAVRSLADVTMRSIEWIDRPLFQRGAFHLLAGKKGCGKGTYTAGLAARATRGDLFGDRHLSEKDTSKGALAAVLGASAWVQIPRVVLVVAADDEDEQLFHIAVAAGNRSARGAGRAFRIELVNVGLKEPVTRAAEA